MVYSTLCIVQSKADYKSQRDALTSEVGAFLCTIKRCISKEEVHQCYSIGRDRK